MNLEETQDLPAYVPLYRWKCRTNYSHAETRGPEDERTLQYFVPDAAHVGKKEDWPDSWKYGGEWHGNAWGHWLDVPEVWL